MGESEERGGSQGGFNVGESEERGARCSSGVSLLHEHNARSGGTPAAPREHDLVWSLVVPGD